MIFKNGLGETKLIVESGFKIWHDESEWYYGMSSGGHIGGESWYTFKSVRDGESITMSEKMVYLCRAEWLERRVKALEERTTELTDALPIIAKEPVKFVPGFWVYTAENDHWNYNGYNKPEVSMIEPSYSREPYDYLVHYSWIDNKWAIDYEDK